MDACANAHTQQHIQPDAPHDVHHLLLRVNSPFESAHADLLSLQNGCGKNEGLNVTLHPGAANGHATQDRQSHTQAHVDDCNGPIKDAGQQNHRSQVDQRRRNQERESHTQRQSGAGKPDEEGNR